MSRLLFERPVGARLNLADDSLFHAVDEALSMKTGLGLSDMADQLPLWWSGQGDPIYSLHGTLRRGGDIDDGTVEWAASNVRSIAKGMGKSLRQEKKNGLALAGALDELAKLVRKPPRTLEQIRAQAQAEAKRTR